MTLTEAVRCVAHCVTFAGLPRGAAPVRVIGAIPNGPAWRCHAILGSGSANHAPASRSNQRLWYVRSRGNQCSTRSSSGARVITPTGPEDCRALIMSSPDQPSTTRSLQGLSCISNEDNSTFRRRLCFPRCLRSLYPQMRGPKPKPACTCCRSMFSQARHRLQIWPMTASSYVRYRTDEVPTSDQLASDRRCIQVSGGYSRRDTSLSA